MQGIAEVATVEDLARLLRQLRRRQARQAGEARLTYRDLAARTGWSRGIIGEYFAGNVLPPTDRFDELIRLLGATPAEQGGLATARDRVEEYRRGQSPTNGSVYLPAGLTRLLGRDGDIRVVVDLLAGSESRLVTLTGPGGVGKTRLALEVAAQLTPEFVDGVAFVSLTALRDPRLVLATIADTLGLRELGVRPLVEILHGYLRSRRVLLVLDNVEQVLPAATQVAALLAAAPRLAVLVTSRSPLRLQGEQIYTVAPRAPAAAVELFAQRVTQAGVDPAGIAPEIVGRICQRLDHLALAIELAAARTRVLPPATMLAHLDPVLSVLGRGGPVLPERQSPSGFVGRVHVLDRLTAVLERALAGRSQLVLLAGEAGIGKTSLAGCLGARASVRGASVAWGTSWDSERAPGFWPWIQVIRSLLRELPDALVAEFEAGGRSELARIVPESGLGAQPLEVTGSPDQARFRLFDAISSFLELAARHRPLTIFLDDLQWADSSSLELLRFICRLARPIPLVLIGAYRHDEIEPTSAVAGVLANLTGVAETVHLAGLEEAEVDELVRGSVGDEIADRWAAQVYQRSGGHPLFARQLSHLLVATPGMRLAIPVAIREAIERRLGRLTPACVRVLEAAAVAGNQVLPDILADVSATTPPKVIEVIAEAVHAGIFVAGDPLEQHARFAHDLYRETLYEGLPVRRRILLHQQVGAALERRHHRGGLAFPGEMARHFAAAVSVDGPDRAVQWAVAAAQADRAGLAFTEAAIHLARVRQAAEDNGMALPAAVVVDLLVMEADIGARGGDTASARLLLDRALWLARPLDDPARLAGVALGVQNLGARFAMPRHEVVALLDEARCGLAGTGSPLEAQVTANLARELSHSVPEHRHRAYSLSEHALNIARTVDEPATLVGCLLASHDVLWRPGTAAQRLQLATEIADLAERHGDRDRRAEGLLLRANALLELGSPAFRADLQQYLHLAAELSQPRYDYFVLARRAALALLDGRIAEGERLLWEASVLGARIGEPDEGNVRMSQMLEVVRARGDPEQLLATADQAVAWWVGVPSHSHAVAAGFRALAGDLEGARRALAVVVELDGWRTDRSYLWSVFVGALTAAASRLRDRRLAGVLYEELRSVAGSCGVNGAVVCFAGSHAHWAGVAAATIDRRAEAIAYLEQALAVHERLGARVWQAESCAELADLLEGAGEQYRVRAAALAAELELHAVAARMNRTETSPLAVTPVLRSVL
jgi:hypothetical protein